jgi:hypothetical protein
VRTTQVPQSAKQALQAPSSAPGRGHALVCLAAIRTRDRRPGFHEARIRDRSAAHA